jgi:hypothetical protein
LGVRKYSKGNPGVSYAGGHLRLLKESATAESEVRNRLG